MGYDMISTIVNTLEKNHMLPLIFAQQLIRTHNINLVDTSGQNILHYIASKHWDNLYVINTALNMLLQIPEFNVYNMEQKDRQGKSPILYAIECNNKACLEVFRDWLKSQNSNINHTYALDFKILAKKDATFLNYLCEANWVNLHDRDKNGVLFENITQQPKASNVVSISKSKSKQATKRASAIVLSQSAVSEEKSDKISSVVSIDRNKPIPKK